MCNKCLLFTDQLNGHKPKDVFYYATLGGKVIAVTAFSVVFSPFILIFAMCAGIGKIIDKIGWQHKVYEL